MRPVTFTVTNAADSAWIKLDHKTSPFHIGFGVVVVSGAPTFTVQHTFDDVDGSTITAFSHPDATAKTTSTDGNYAYPVRAIRVSQTGTGVTRVVIIQAGHGG